MAKKWQKQDSKETCLIKDSDLCILLHFHEYVVVCLCVFVRMCAPFIDHSLIDIHID